LGLGQIEAPSEHDSVVEADVDVGVVALVGTAADSTEPPDKLSRYSTPLSRHEVLSPLHESREPLVQADPFFFSVCPSFVNASWFWTRISGRF